MPAVATRAGNISYEIQGSRGVPIILLHATLHDHHDYDSIIPSLAQNHQVVAIDWPFHGSSDHPTSPALPTASFFADVLVDVVTTLKLPPAILIGNSVGGFVAARLAITHPEHVRALVLVNSGGFVPWNIVSKFFTRLLGIQTINRHLTPYLVHRYMSPQTPLDHAITDRVAALARTAEGSKIAAAIWRSFLDPEYDMRSRADEIKVPVLLVWGARDPVVPLYVGRASHEVLKGSRFEVVDAGHVVFSSKPDEFLGLLRPFIDEVLGGENESTVSSG